MKGGHTDVEPDGKDGSVDDGRHQHTPVEAGPASCMSRPRRRQGQEALEVVDGREAGLGIACLPKIRRRQVEGQELAVRGSRPSGVPSARPIRLSCRIVIGVHG